MKKFKPTERAQAALRKMAEAGSAFAPKLTDAEELVRLGLAETDGMGGVRITSDGRKYLREIER
jgi:Mn-dependent DtxR family transcriptional regulator